MYIWRDEPQAPVWILTTGMWSYETHQIKCNLKGHCLHWGHCLWDYSTRALTEALTILSTLRSIWNCQMLDCSFQVFPDHWDKSDRLMIEATCLTKAVFSSTRLPKGEPDQLWLHVPLPFSLLALADSFSLGFMPEHAICDKGCPSHHNDQYLSLAIHF